MPLEEGPAGRSVAQCANANGFKLYVKNSHAGMMRRLVRIEHAQPEALVAMPENGKALVQVFDGEPIVLGNVHAPILRPKLAPRQYRYVLSACIQGNTSKTYLCGTPRY